jgi:NTP pyrophosphatase (non-canonical NTP hydrolase)
MKGFKGLYFQEYELQAKKTASYLDSDYLPLGLAEETGELIQLFAAAKRKGGGILIGDLKSEMGDILWVLSQIAREYGFSLEEAAEENIRKLSKRNQLGAIHEKQQR